MCCDYISPFFFTIDPIHDLKIEYPCNIIELVNPNDISQDYSVCVEKVMKDLSVRVHSLTVVF
jgi:hypothetical protein